MEATTGTVTVSVIDTYGNKFAHGMRAEAKSSIMQVKTVVSKNDAGRCCSFCNKRYSEREESNRWDVFDCSGGSMLGYFIVCSDCRFFAVYQIHNVGDNVYLQYADDDVWYKHDTHYGMNY